jgi:protein ImuA
MTGARPDPGDEAAAILFVAGIAARFAARDDGRDTVLWVLARRDLFAPGLALAGLPPERMLYAHCGRDEEILAVMEEGLRHGGLAAVVGEVQRAAMTATRRLQLAAEAGKTPGLMLKGWRRRDEDPLAPPSAATTRWRIGCVPSAALAVPGIARPRWRIELARQRGGEGWTWTMEGSDAEGRLALPAEPADRAAAAGGERPREAA